MFGKAVGKKIPAEMALQKAKFIEGCIKTSGWSRAKATEIWAWIEPFAAYGFNKAHSASYAMVTYQTAYLKANYPHEFMAAVLTAESHDLDKVAAAVEECKKMRINVLPPDVNESYKMFAVITPTLQGLGTLDQKPIIRWSLTAIKNVGTDVAAEVVRERKENGPYASFSDFIARMPTKVLNRKSLESLICCGAFDAMADRNTLLSNLENVLEATRASKKNLIDGQVSLFGTLKSPSVKPNLALEPAEPATLEQKLNWEKELLGLYITAHPLEEYRDLLQKTTPIKKVSELREGTFVTVGGVLSKIHKITTRKGEPMAFLTMEDLSGSVECICFPRLYTKSMELIDGNLRILASGKVSEKDGEPKLILEDLMELTEENVKRNGKIAISVPSIKTYVLNKAETPKAVVSIPSAAAQDIFGLLKSAFEQYPGNTQIVLMIPDNNGNNRQVATSYRVDLNSELKNKIKEILNSHNS